MKNTSIIFNISMCDFFKKTTFLALLLCAIKVRAQETNSTFNEPVMHSPTVMSLGKYVDFPISLYTGQTNVSVPIYNLKVGDIEVPISLKYHTAGTRVGDIASSVGMNWSLIANSTVIRTINGKADKYLVDYFYENPPYQLNNSNFFEHYSTATGGRDSEHDYFHFSAGNYSGKYIYDFPTREVLQFPVQDIEIKPAFTKDKAIEIITPDGLIYTFGLTEFNNSRSRCSNGSGGKAINDFVPLTWFLTRIESVTTSAYVDFNYESKHLQYESNGTQVKYINQISHLGDYECTISNNIYSHRLISIESSDGQKVEFLKGNERLDLKNDYVLNEIQVSKANSNRVKRYKLDHKYLNRNEFYEEGSDYLINADEEKLRLFLVGVQEVDENNNALAPHEFKYNMSSTGLPSRRSFAQDMWGYYNGKNGNSTTVPALVYQGRYYRGADRQPYQDAAINGTLREVTFPTGGKRTFQYELNECTNCGFIKNISSNDTPQYTRHTIGDNIVGELWNESKSIYQKTFEAYTPGEIIFDTSTESNFCGSVPCEVEMRLYELNNDGSIKKEIFDSYNYRYVEGEDVNSIHEVIDYRFNGTYKLEFIVNDFEWARFQDTYTLTVRWLNPIDMTTLPKYNTVGGLRVSEIINYDPVVDKSIRQTYQYEDGYLTSGLSFAKEKEYIYNQVLGYPTQVFYGYAIERFSQPVLSASTTKGGIVGYGKVTVFEEDNGYSENYFYSSRQNPDENFEDSPGVFSTSVSYLSEPFPHGSSITGERFEDYPFTLKNEKDWKRGLLKEKIIFNNDGDIVSKIANSYNFYDNPNLPEYDESKVKTVWGSKTDGSLVYDQPISLGPIHGSSTYKTGSLYINFYKLESSWYDLIETKETQYNPDGSKVVTVKNFEYSPNQRSVQKVTQTDSTGDKIERINLYPTDVNLVLGSDLLQEANILHKPINQKTLVNDIVTNETTYEYTTSSGLIILHVLRQYFKENQDAIQTNLFYDDFGNITQISREGKAHVSYIWGYNKQFPVAKLENASRYEIASLNSFGFNFHTDTGGLSQNQENTLRTSLPNAMITTYAHDPMAGITKIVDPSGYTMTYHYDAFNRLEFVKDNDGNLVSENKYNYKN